MLGHLSVLLEKRVGWVSKLVSSKARWDCLGAVIIDLCDLVLGASPCCPDQSLLSSRPSCDGHRRSRTACLVLIQQKHEGKKGGRLQIYPLLTVQLGPIHEVSHHLVGYPMLCLKVRSSGSR
ncbi:unnamed protein product [Protopolystoma xenopodis]|uniref:Uncharacterized protein n=1 Tax=Protopolystoma xenopodis TaxID=117903 RepID=A0A3S5BQT8_9PLAT|nr:unnamed protein product [Protopolystoma xenopodis]